MVEFKESKFYKLLQDFFINNDKETFLQFLAEFYNKTEGIIVKNEMQDEIIKELRETFLLFNEEGIDENIVREKVNYFIENNKKIQDIITKIIRNKNNIENITTQMDIKTSEIKNLNDNKMDKNTKDISVTQINKNLGKLDETYMSESLLAKMTGEGTFGSVPEDKSITTIKLASKSIKANNTDFIATKNNDLLLNIQFVYNKYVSYLDGALHDSDAYKCTDFVAVSPGQKLVTNQSNHVAYYNSSKVFLSGLEGGKWDRTLVVPPGASFIRLNYTNNVNAYLYEVGEDNLYSLETLIANTEMEKLIKRLSAKSNNDIPVVKDIYKLIYENIVH